MEPITRQEMFLAAAFGEEVEMPEPITREEMYLKSIAEKIGELDTKTGTVTTNTSPFSVVSIVVKQSGKVVTINGYAEHISGNANTTVYFGKISNVDLPSSEIRAIAGVAAHAYDAPTQIGYLTVSSQGGIGIRCPQTFSNQAIYFSVSYIV